MSLPHNCAIQTSPGIRHRRLWLQNQSAIVLQQIRFNNLPASGLQSGSELKRKEKTRAPAGRSLPCQRAAVQPGPPTLRCKHSRSAQTVASRGLRQGTQGRASGSRISFCEHLLGLGRHRKAGPQAKTHQVYHHWCRTSWNSDNF